MGVEAMGARLVGLGRGRMPVAARRAGPIGMNLVAHPPHLPAGTLQPSSLLGWMAPLEPSFFASKPTKRVRGFSCKL